MPTITKVEFTSFAYRLEGIAVDEGHNTVYNPGGAVNRTGPPSASSTAMA